MSNNLTTLYRKTSIGVSLVEILDQLVSENSLTGEQALKIMGIFDKSITNKLNFVVKTKCTFNGSCSTFNFCDDVWTFTLKDVWFRTDTETIRVPDYVKLVAADSKHFQTNANK